MFGLLHQANSNSTNIRNVSVLETVYKKDQKTDKSTEVGMYINEVRSIGLN